MKSYGVPDAWLDLIASLVPDILQLVWSTWQTMPALAPDSLEDPTTEELCRRLRQSRSAAELPFRIDIQMVELGESADDETGRMDIVFSPMLPTERVYFCLECKRLNVTKLGSRRSCANEYVVHGMRRFVTGRYASHVPQGGMLGYVLDGDVESAMEQVSVAIRRRWRELGMQPPGLMIHSSILSMVATTRETRHRRAMAAPPFVIHHVFAPATTV